MKLNTALEVAWTTMSIFIGSTFCFENAKTHSLRGAGVTRSEAVISDRRKLMETHHLPFNPLSCNSNLSSASCQPWAPSSLEQELVTIPCGECRYLVNNGGAEITFAKGLDIQGKLKISPTSTTKLTIKTPFIFVQGEFAIFDHSIVRGGDGPNLNILVTDHSAITGSVDVMLDLANYVHSENSHVCSMESCHVGKRAIVIAGGKLSIEGWDPSCPTWVKLDDTIPKDLPPGCNSTNLITSNGNAEDLGAGTLPFIGSGATLTTISDATVPEQGQFFRATGRSSGRHGLSVEFLPDCIQFAGVYKWTSKVRIHTNETHDVKVKMEVYDAVSNDWSTLDHVVSCGDHTFDDGFVDCSGIYAFKWSLREQYGPNANYRIRYQVSHDTCDVDYDDISFDIIQAPVDRVIVDSAVASCWGATSEILITSDNENYDGDQLSLIESINNSTGTPAGKVTIFLPEPIIKPTTMTDSSDFAVEVALLNRNIVFQPNMTGESNDFHGGHLIVLHTPSVQQLIEGIEVRRFGQQGNIGRYPLHFHMSDDVAGAVVAHNLIRDSNQRCVVVHGTHNLTISNNVAYDTFGHCYFLEDGGELDNRFLGNLGARTKKAIVKIGPDETDDEPSTFWMSNPSNIWENNVAAGSFSHGFWMELRKSVRGPSAMLPENLERVPMEANLGSFRDNVAHSNEKMGVRNYPLQYDPPNYAYFVNTKSFKNQRSGIFLHGLSRGVIEGGVVAANGDYGIDIDRADNVKIVNTTVMGFISNQSYPCTRATAITSSINGIDLHTYERRTEPSIEKVWPDPASYFGAEIRNVTFANFDVNACGHQRMSELGYDPDIRDGHFDFWTDVSGLNIPSNAEINMCDAIAVGGVNDIVVHDTDGSFASSFDTTFSGDTAFVISDTEEMKAFIDVTNQCVHKENMCAQYCQGVCLRTINFGVPSHFNNLRLEVSDGSHSALYEGHFRLMPLLNSTGGDTLDEFGNVVPDTIFNTDYLNFRYYPVTVPSGTSYTAVFKDENGLPVWPMGVEAYETHHDLCSPASLDIELIRPTVSEGKCDELITNGNPEIEIDPIESHWYQERGSLIDFVVSDIGGYALLNTERADKDAGVGQFIDNRCLIEGMRYEVKAKMKLVEASNGSAYVCTYITDCPSASITTRTYNQEGNRHIETNYNDIAQVQIIPNQGEWLSLYGVFEVTAEMAAANTVFFYLSGASISKNIMLDEVSISPYVDPTPANINVIENGNFDSGSSFWTMQSGSMTVTNSQGGYVLEALGRYKTYSGPRQELSAGSLTEGQPYEVSIKFQLRDASSGEYLACENGVSCPVAKIQSLKDGTKETYTVATIAFPLHLGPDGWSKLYGRFTADAFQGAADSHSFRIQDADIGVDLIVDDVSIVPIDPPEPCANLVSNGDAAHGQTDGWSKWGSGTQLGIICPGAGGMDCAFLAHSRESSTHGMNYDLEQDGMCLFEGESWRIIAQVKLVNATTGIGVSCDPAVTWDCPMVRIVSTKSGYRNELVHVEDTNMIWDSNDFNTFNTTFIATSDMATYERNRFVFLGGDKRYDLVVDEVHVTKAFMSDSESSTL